MRYLPETGEQVTNTIKYTIKGGIFSFVLFHTAELYYSVWKILLNVLFYSNEKMNKSTRIDTCHLKLKN